MRAYCGNCGAEIDADARFCESCGAEQDAFKLGEAPAEEEAKAPVPGPPASPPEAQLAAPPTEVKAGTGQGESVEATEGPDGEAAAASGRAPRPGRLKVLLLAAGFVLVAAVLAILLIGGEKDCTVRGPGVDLGGCDLASADLGGENLSNANLQDVDLTDSKLERADLTGADLSGADLSGADIERADLSGADLSGADLSGADLKRAIVGDTNLAGATLADADLRGAKLGRADLTGAELTGADLSGSPGSFGVPPADLSDADLSDADLSDADLSDGKLTGADLTGAALTGAALDGVNLVDAVGVDDPVLAGAVGVSRGDLPAWLAKHKVALEDPSVVREQLEKVCNGVGVQEAATTPTGLLAIRGDGGVNAPGDWEPVALRHAHLVACIGNKDVQISQCNYEQGTYIFRFQRGASVVVREARTGKNVASMPFVGGTPEECPGQISVTAGSSGHISGLDVYGSSPSAEIVGWLEQWRGK